MSALKYIERLQRMDQLIRMKATGNSHEFAAKMGISRSVLMETIRDLRDLGCHIEFCSARRSYYYENNGKFYVGFLSAEQGSCRGGASFYDFFLLSDNVGLSTYTFNTKNCKNEIFDNRQQ